jgi:hypothetical protein
VALAGRGENRVDTTVQAILRDTVEVAQGAGHAKPSRAGLSAHLNDLPTVVAKDVGAQAATSFKAAYAYAKVVAVKAFGAADDADAADLAHQAIAACFDGQRPAGLDDDDDDDDEDEDDDEPVQPAGGGRRRRGRAQGAAPVEDAQRDRNAVRAHCVCATVLHVLIVCMCTRSTGGDGYRQPLFPMTPELQAMLAAKRAHAVAAKAAVAAAAATANAIPDDDATLGAALARMATVGPAVAAAAVPLTLEAAIAPLQLVARQQGRIVDVAVAERGLAEATAALAPLAAAKAEAQAALRAFVDVHRAQLRPARVARLAPTPIEAERDRLKAAVAAASAAAKPAEYSARNATDRLRHVRAAEAGPAAVAAAEQALAAAVAAADAEARAVAALSRRARARRAKAHRAAARAARAAAAAGHAPPADTRTAVERAQAALAAARCALLGHWLALALPSGASKAHAKAYPLLYLPVAHACHVGVDAYTQARVRTSRVSCTAVDVE